MLLSFKTCFSILCLTKDLISIALPNSCNIPLCCSYNNLQYDRSANSAARFKYGWLNQPAGTGLLQPVLQWIGCTITGRLGVWGRGKWVEIWSRCNHACQKSQCTSQSSPQRAPNFWITVIIRVFVTGLKAGKQTKPRPEIKQRIQGAREDFPPKEMDGAYR